ncbi:Protein NETWORKED 1A [Arachis hypogaea]|nr:Protein NETWORKED 1A [Arachis hypogaea]
MDELLIENAFMKFPMYRLYNELDGLRATAKKFQESSEVLQEEKSILVAKKLTLLLQLQIIQESMKKKLEMNTLLEKSLLDVKIELLGTKAKSSHLEGLCKLLTNEKNNLLTERRVLVSQLESVEAGLEEQQSGKIEFEKELDKAVNAQIEMFILPSSIEDLEQNNLTLLIECEKHVEASKFSDKVISELESENLIIEGLKSSAVRSQEEKQQLLVENSVLNLYFVNINSQRANQVLREEDSKLLEEKRSLLKSVLDLKDAISVAKDENNVILHEILALSNLNLELHKLRKMFELTEAENVYLNKSIERMDKELQEAKDTSFHLSHQIENSENLVKKKGAELLEMEKRLKASETLSY